MQSRKFTIAAAQFAPVFLNKKETVKKACDIIAEAGRSGAKLIVFPEAFIAGYPDWAWIVPNSRAAVLNELYTEMVNNAVERYRPDES